jgi:hypothetical protein
MWLKYNADEPDCIQKSSDTQFCEVAAKNWYDCKRNQYCTNEGMLKKADDTFLKVMKEENLEKCNKRVSLQFTELKY